MDDDEYDDDEGSEQVSSVLFKALIVIVLIGVVIALGTTIVVRALGLNEGASSSGPVGSDSETTKPLPTSALPVPGEDEGSGRTTSPTTTSPPSPPARRAGSSSTCRR